MRACLISLGSTSSKMTYEAMKRYFDEVDSLSIKNIEVNIGGKGAQVLHQGEPLREYDCVYPKGSFRYVSLLRSITTTLSKRCYVPYQSASYSIGHDKLLTQLKLQEHNVPMPQTYLSSTDSSRQILEKITYPIVMKFPSGTQGKGVMFADSYSSASSMLDALSMLDQPFIIQEYVECDGSDIRAIVVGSNVVAAMKRKAEMGEKRANIHAGGIGVPCELDNYAKRIAIKAAEATGAEICGVDILEGPKGPMVIEINVSPGLQGITSVTGIDVADAIAKHLADKTHKFLSDGATQEKVLDEKGLGGDELIRELTTQLSFRAGRILLPQAITDITGFDEFSEVRMHAKTNYLQIDKVERKKEVE